MKHAVLMVQSIYIPEGLSTLCEQLTDFDLLSSHDTYQIFISLFSPIPQKAT